MPDLSIRILIIFFPDLILNSEKTKEKERLLKSSTQVVIQMMMKLLQLAVYLYKSTQNAKTIMKPSTSDSPTTPSFFLNTRLCTDIRLSVKIIYLPCCTLV